MPDPGFPPLFGGVAALDFANTLDGRATAQPEEFLRGYADVAGWAAYAGLIDGKTAGRLTDLFGPGGRAGEGEGALRTAVELREAIFQVFGAVGRGEPAPPAALAVVQARYSDAMAVARLAAEGDGFAWRFAGDDPGRAWWPVAVSAVRLLTGGPLDRVKVCAAEAGCIGLFLDTSKNRSRRWCTMDGCGVEAKVQRQARRRAARRA
ncbi:CGNR zinc finger domain-containing protein [Actinoplanes sp. CA-030573]|uniref:CGNR zinc finger domain-containing protein n=1 Tax=Actinoplanes sp. CA-030573 TaxID=3239898 RepID=UPI003D8BB637